MTIEMFHYRKSDKIQSRLLIVMGNKRQVREQKIGNTHQFQPKITLKKNRKHLMLDNDCDLKLVLERRQYLLFAYRL